MMTTMNLARMSAVMLMTVYPRFLLSPVQSNKRNVSGLTEGTYNGLSEVHIGKGHNAVKDIVTCEHTMLTLNRAKDFMFSGDSGYLVYDITGKIRTICYWEDRDSHIA